MKILGMLAAFIILFMFSANTLPAEREQEKNPPLSKQEIQKLRDIAMIIAGEITRRNVKSVTVINFKDIEGNPSKMGKTASVEFRKQMEALGKTNFTVVDSGGEAFVTGMFLPFKGGDKWRLDIKILSPDNRLITSYSGFFRKTKGVKK
ncbi:MAG: hypothetical protein Q8M34_05035 [Thermodesulfovibrionales bacterium]|nr:hypothetical protein [Thermodesulfovibrionales bacterium]